MNVKQTAFFTRDALDRCNRESMENNEWGSEIISCHGSSNSQGVANLFKNGIDCTINHKIVDPELLKACV